jgi:hypothetical protein
VDHGRRSFGKLKPISPARVGGQPFQCISHATIRLTKHFGEFFLDSIDLARLFGVPVWSAPEHGFRGFCPGDWPVGDDVRYIYTKISHIPSQWKRDKAEQLIKEWALTPSSNWNWLGIPN